MIIDENNSIYLFYVKVLRNILYMIIFDANDRDKILSQKYQLTFNYVRLFLKENTRCALLGENKHINRYAPINIILFVRDL